MVASFRRQVLLLSLVMLFSGSAFVQAEPFAIARVKYSGGGDWYGDPSSLVNLQKFLRENTGLETANSEDVVSLTDEDLFAHPYLYLTGHGNLVLSPEEASRLREYLLGGGFLHIDDNYGLNESLRRELKKVFPEYSLVELPFTHPIYHIAYDFPNGLPKIHEHDGKPAQGFGIVVNGRVVLFYSYECDLGDGWEDPDVHNDPPEKHTAALKMGTNLVMYVLSGFPEKLP